mgnify:CR=1 FL=1
MKMSFDFRGRSLANKRRREYVTHDWENMDEEYWEGCEQEEEDGYEETAGYEESYDEEYYGEEYSEEEPYYEEEQYCEEEYYEEDLAEEDGEVVPCVVYVATYLKHLAAEEKTAIDAITAVTLNAAADTDIIENELYLFMDLNSDGECDTGELRVNAQGNNHPFTIEIEVAAEAVQVEGMPTIEDNVDVNGDEKGEAADALDTAFGVPGEYNLSDAGEKENAISWTFVDPAFDPAPTYVQP